MAGPLSMWRVALHSGATLSSAWLITPQSRRRPWPRERSSGPTQSRSWRQPCCCRSRRSRLCACGDVVKFRVTQAEDRDSTRRPGITMVQIVEMAHQRIQRSGRPRPRVGLLLPNLLHRAQPSTPTELVHTVSNMNPDKLDQIVADDEDWAAAIRAGYRPTRSTSSRRDVGGTAGHELDLLSLRLPLVLRVEWCRCRNGAQTPLCVAIPVAISVPAHAIRCRSVPVIRAGSGAAHGGRTRNLGRYARSATARPIPSSL